MSTLQVRGIDSDIKLRAEAVFRQMGITASSAIKMYFNQIAITGALPFQPTTVTQNGFTPAQENEILKNWKDESGSENFSSMKECLESLKK